MSSVGHMEGWCPTGRALCVCLCPWQAWHSAVAAARSALWERICALGATQSPHPCHNGDSIHESIAQVWGARRLETPNSCRQGHPGHVIVQCLSCSEGPLVACTWDAEIPTLGARSCQSIHSAFSPDQ